MNVLLLGLLYDANHEDLYLNKSRCGMQNASNAFQWSLITGFLSCFKNSGTDTFTVINSLPVGCYPFKYKELIVKSKQWFFDNSTIANKEVGFINFPIIKSLDRYRRIKKELDNWLDSISGEKVVIVYNLYRPFLRVVNELRQERTDFKIVNIVLDMTLGYGKKSNSIIRRIYECVEERGTLDDFSYVDGFVLLTQKMTIPLKIQNKPYIVIEGLIDSNQFQTEPSVNSLRNYIFYSGTLDLQYGILNLIEAFVRYRNMVNCDVEFWLCGTGDAQSNIVELASQYPFIKYLGYLSRKKVLELQQSSLLLVNPRPNIGDYVKYSFPSKTLEYMASGKVVLMNKLDGVPDEYDSYLVYFDSLNPDLMANSLKNILCVNRIELHQMGLKNRCFALEFKNSLVQVSKIIEFCTAIIAD